MFKNVWTYSRIFCCNIWQVATMVDEKHNPKQFFKQAREGDRFMSIVVWQQCDQIGRFLNFGQPFKAGGNNYFT